MPCLRRDERAPLGSAGGEDWPMSSDDGGGGAAAPRTLFASESAGPSGAPHGGSRPPSHAAADAERDPSSCPTGSPSVIPPSEASPPRRVAELRGAARTFVPHWAPGGAAAGHDDNSAGGAGVAERDGSLDDDDGDYVDPTPPDKRARGGA